MFDRTLPRHPLAFYPNRSGCHGISSDDLFIYNFNERIGRLDEALSDGDAYITWSDGTYDTIKWHHIRPIPAGDDT